MANEPSRKRGQLRFAPGMRLVARAPVLQV